MAEPGTGVVQEVRTLGGATIVALRGELDLHRASALRAALSQEVTARPPRLILNLANVAYIDSTGLGTLVYFLRQVNGYGGRLFLVGLTPVVRNVFEITRLLHVFAVHENEAAALNA
jgi:anti-anti-sigma factor